MESHSGAAAADELQAIERERLAVYAGARAPGWAWPVFGIGAGLYLGSLAVQNNAVRLVSVGLWAAFIGLWVSVVYRRSGVAPRLRGMPRPLLHEVWWFWAVGAVLAVAAVAVGVATSFVLAGPLTGAVAAVGGTAYERRCERLASRLLAEHSRR